MYKKINIHVMTISEMNKREHWRAAHARHKKQKTNVRKALEIENIPRMLPCRVKMIRVGKKKLDSDNLQGAFKYVRDAIAEYFIPGLAAGRADDDPGFLWEYDQVKGLPSIQVEFDWMAHDSVAEFHADREEKRASGVDKSVSTSLGSLLAEMP